MRNLNVRLRLYIGFVAALGLGVSAWSALLQPVWPDARMPALAAALAVLIGITGAFPVPIGSKVKVDGIAGPVFVAVLLLPPWLAAVAAGLGIAVSQVIRKWRWPQVVLNTSSALFYVGVAGLLYATMNPGGALSYGRPLGLIGIALAAAAVYSANRVVVVVAASLQTGKNQLHLWQREWKQDAVREFAFLFLGFVSAFAGYLAPLVLAGLFLLAASVNKGLGKVILLRVRLRRDIAARPNTTATVDAQSGAPSPR